MFWRNFGVGRESICDLEIFGVEKESVNSSRKPKETSNRRASFSNMLWL